MRASILGVAAILSFAGTSFAASPAASLSDISWLSGSWEGAGIEGAPALEAYSPAAGGQIVGHFRQLNKDGSVMFYEIITIVQDGPSLAYRLKHFNADLSGWEDKDKVVVFPLTAANDQRWDFSGLIYERTGADTMTASVLVDGANGEKETLVFRFHRKGQ